MDALRKPKKGAGQSRLRAISGKVCRRNMQDKMFEISRAQLRSLELPDVTADDITAESSLIDDLDLDSLLRDSFAELGPHVTRLGLPARDVLAYVWATRRKQLQRVGLETGLLPNSANAPDDAR